MHKAEQGLTDAHSKNASDPGEAMLVESALGDDRSLATHGADPHYWYSMANGTTLLTAIRESRLTYRTIAVPGQEHSVLRENVQRVLLSNPYHAGNFVESIRDDIARIVNGYGEDPELNRWTQMPLGIVIPILAGQHWRVIRVKMDYEHRKASILWDDPKGIGTFPQYLKEAVLPSILESILTLIRKQIKDETFAITPDAITQEEKALIQQSTGNAWDCGPIAFDNVRSYSQNPDRESVSYGIDLDSDMLAVRARDRHVCLGFVPVHQEVDAITTASLAYGIAGAVSSAPPPPPPLSGPNYYAAGDLKGEPDILDGLIIGNTMPLNVTEANMKLSL